MVYGLCFLDLWFSVAILSNGKGKEKAESKQALAKEDILWLNYPQNLSFVLRR